MGMSSVNREWSQNPSDDGRCQIFKFFTTKYNQRYFQYSVFLFNSSKENNMILDKDPVELSLFVYLIKKQHT